DVALLRVRVVEVRRSELNAYGSSGTGSDRENIRKHRRRGIGFRIQRVARLVLCVGQEESIQDSAMESSVEDAVTGAHHRLVTHCVGDAESRSKILRGRVDRARLRIVGIGYGRLRKRRVLISQAIVQRQLAGELPDILRVERIVRGTEIED